MMVRMEIQKQKALYAELHHFILYVAFALKAYYNSKMIARDFAF